MGADEIDNQYYQQFLLKPFFDKNKIKTEANQNSYIRTQHRVNQVNGKGFCSLMNDDDNEPIKVYTFEESSIQIFDNVVGSIISNWGRFIFIATIVYVIFLLFCSLIDARFLDITLFLIIVDKLGKQRATQKVYR